MTAPVAGLKTDRSRLYDWDRYDAAHLLRRAGFGASEAAIERAAAEGLEATVQRLLTQQPETDEFRATEAVLRRTAHDVDGIADLKTWWLYRMRYTANPLLEKLTLFWHNHFATSHAKVRSVQHMAAQNDLFRRHALGSFRELLHGISRDVAMLIWLDGNANRKRHPNENFARELMELFSLGEGNYTERDLIEAARALTGWHVRKDEFWFNRAQHDFGSKTVFGTTGKLNGDDVVKLCLDKPACPRFLAGKLLRRFVLPDPPTKSTDELAGRIRQHDFAMTPVLRELFTSELFFAPAARHAIIKSPLDLVIGTYRTLEIQPDLRATARLLAELGQDVFEPPSVEGWNGGRLWINSATLLQRANFAADLTTGERYGRSPDFPADGPDDLVGHYVDLLLARELDRSTIASIREFVTETGGARGRRVRGLIHLLLTMPEYQLV